MSSSARARLQTLPVIYGISTMRTLCSQVIGLQVGDVKSCAGFSCRCPKALIWRRDTVVLFWCEAFGEFITSAQYRWQRGGCHRPYAHINLSRLNIQLPSLLKSAPAAP